MDKTTPITAGPDGIFEIQDPAVDQDAVVQRVEACLRAHRRLFAKAPTMPSFGPGGQQIAAEPEADPSDLLYYLRRAEECRDQLGAEQELAPSWATQLPVIGRWWGRIRRELHNLVLFYVNRAAGRQAGFNAYAVEVLRYIAKQEEGIKHLRAQVALLEDRLAALEKRE
jgi:hypothetical protein